MMTPRASAKTTIKLGDRLEAGVSLYKTMGDPPGSPTFVKASPIGNEIEPIAVGLTGYVVGSTTRADPLAEVAATATTSFKEPSFTYRDAVTKEPLEDGDIRRGIRRDDGEFVDLTEHLDQIDADAKLEAMEIIAFIRQEKIPRERIVGSYWLAPEDDRSAKVLRLVGEGMRGAGRVALARWTKRSRQALGVIINHKSGALLVLELEFFSRTREPVPQALRVLEVSATIPQIEAAVALVQSMGDTPVVIDEIDDAREVAISALVECALTGEPLPDLQESRPLVEDDLMGALSKALDG